MRLFITHDLSLTGAPRLVVDTYKALYRDGDLLIAKRSGPLLAELAAAGFPCQVSDTSHELSVSSKQALVYARQIIQRHTPEVVYANTVGSIEWAVAAAEAGVPSILHVHELDSVREEFVRIGHYSTDQHLMATLTLCASDRIHEELARSGIPSARLQTIGVAIDEARVLTGAGQRTNEHEEYFARRGAGLGDGRRRYCMVGSACHRKGIDIFLEAALMMPDRDFIWVGGLSNERFMKRFSKRLANAPKNFYLTGWLINPFPILADSEALILTAREDPNPLVVYEALALGKKVICFASTGDSHVRVRQHYPVATGAPDPVRISRAVALMDELPAHAPGNGASGFSEFLRKVQGAITHAERA